jgi:hypothetical protein
MADIFNDDDLNDLEEPSDVFGDSDMDDVFSVEEIPVDEPEFENEFIYDKSDIVNILKKSSNAFSKEDGVRFLYDIVLLPFWLNNIYDDDEKANMSEYYVWLKDVKFSELSGSEWESFIETNGSYIVDTYKEHGGNVSNIQAMDKYEDLQENLKEEKDLNDRIEELSEEQEDTYLTEEEREKIDEETEATMKEMEENGIIDEEVSLSDML